jgi:hypothetical protein
MSESSEEESGEKEVVVIQEREPRFSCKVNVTALIAQNKRATIKSHVKFLAENMRVEVKDRKHPLILSVDWNAVSSAKDALEKGFPYPFKIIVVFVYFVDYLLNLKFLF